MMLRTYLFELELAFDMADEGMEKESKLVEEEKLIEDRL